MRIKGRFNFKEVFEFIRALGAGYLAGLLIYGFFALTAMIHWIVAWSLISIIIAPVIFWGARYLEGKIEIDPIEDEDEESSCDFIDTGW